MQTTTLIKGAALAAAIILAGSKATAIEQFKAIPLPDLGFGSSAQAGYTPSNGTGDAVVGQVNDPLGRSLAWGWDLDNDGVVTNSFGLPLPAGFQGGCSGGWEFADGQRVVLGNLIGTDGRTHAVLWRKPPMGSWSMPQMLAPNATQSFTADDDPDHFSDTLLAAVSVQTGGVWRPAVATITSFLVNVEALPVLGNRDAMALGIDRDESGDTVVTGWATLATGLRKPAAWDLDNDGYRLSLIAVPQGASGAGRAAAIDDGLWYVAGDMTRNGRTRGIWVPQGSPFIVLEALPAFENSTAYNLGDTATHEIGHVIFGDSSNPGSAPVSTVWIDMRPLSVQQLLADPTSVAQVNRFRMGGPRAGLGNVMQSAGALSQACLFLSTSTHVPDRLRLPVGNALGGADVDALWHTNDVGLGVRTEKVNHQRMACVDVDFTPMSVPTGQTLNFGADILFPPPGVTGGTVNVYFLNRNTQQFQPFYTNNPGGGLLGISAPIPSAAMDPNTGEVTLRIEFKHGGNQPKHILMETVTMTCE